MKYQLVVQLPESSVQDFDVMIELEEAILKVLEEEGEVDGHDIGSGTMNIFIFTDEPTKAFAKLEPMLDKRRLLSSAKAAYRDADGDDFTILFPEDLTEFSIA